ncbi:hypothetical protein O6H91_21G014000 [Diphasiastrum complanatum]|uniref:Uncharacterized protein n=1 Tax=Diphasiastrum complanatum TaxID=34168 RepID=A0ACC2AHY5_DIPCM|nr:hypothetical protein O6H91_21G014000 [Diphasiastrum complanatum]
MESCSLLSSFYSSRVTSSISHLQCGELSLHETRFQTLPRKFAQDLHSFNVLLPHFRCASIGVERPQVSNKKQSLKRESQYSFLNSSCRDGFSFSSSSRRSSQLSSLAVDVSFYMPADMGLDEVIEEIPSSLAQCKDLEWERLVDDLRKEAVSTLNADESDNELSRKGGTDSGNWDVEKCTDRMLEWDTASAVEQLRGQVSFLVAQELVRMKNGALDNDNTAILSIQYQILSTCSHLNEQASQFLADDAVGSAQNLDGAGPHVRKELQMQETRSPSLSSTVAAVFLIQGAAVMDAFAAEAGNPTQLDPVSQSLEAAITTPAWLIPAILACPVISYLLFNVYRDQVNPYAKISDWLFGVVVLVIIGNIITMATLGVRLY